MFGVLENKMLSSVCENAFLLEVCVPQTKEEQASGESQNKKGDLDGKRPLRPDHNS